jgi:hypothetical protein
MQPDRAERIIRHAAFHYDNAVPSQDPPQDMGDGSHLRRE